MRMTKAQRRVLYKRIHSPKDYTIWEDESKHSPLCIAAIVPFRWKEVFDRLIQNGTFQRTFEKIWFDQYWFPGAISTDPQLVYDKLINFRGNVGKFAWQILEILKPYIGGKDYQLHPLITSTSLKPHWSTHPLTYAKVISGEVEEQKLLWKDLPIETVPEKQESQVKKNVIMRDRQEIRGGWEVSDILDLRQTAPMDAIRRIPSLANMPCTVQYKYPYYYYLRHGKYTISSYFPQFLLPNELRSHFGMFESFHEAEASRDLIFYNLHHLQVAVFTTELPYSYTKTIGNPFHLGTFKTLTEAVEIMNNTLWPEVLKPIGQYYLGFFTDEIDETIARLLPVFKGSGRLELQYVL